MSYSTLWVMDKDFKGYEIEEYHNSWLFAPISWDILYEKYLPNEIFDAILGGKKHYISSAMFDRELFNRLNNKINNTPIQVDRVIWELTNQQVFFTKDKIFVSNCIKDFLGINAKYIRDCGEHIFQRFNELSDDIINIDENEYLYFISKNTSVDDNVDGWFRKYNEEDDECKNCSLKEVEKHVAEFVIIKDNAIDKFISNIDYF